MVTFGDPGKTACPSDLHTNWPARASIGADGDVAHLHSSASAMRCCAWPRVDHLCVAQVALCQADLFRRASSNQTSACFRQQALNLPSILSAFTPT